MVSLYTPHIQPSQCAISFIGKRGSTLTRSLQRLPPRNPLNRRSHRTRDKLEVFMGLARAASVAAVEECEYGVRGTLRGEDYLVGEC